MYIYSRLCHNPYPIKCILLENSHRFERRKDSHVHKPSFVHGWFHFRIISPWNRFPWTPPNGPEWVWVMTESTVLNAHIYDISKEYKAEARITEQTLGRRVVAMKQSIVFCTSTARPYPCLANAPQSWSCGRANQCFSVR